MREELRKHLQPRMRDYLAAEDIYPKTCFVPCPVCKGNVYLREDGTWRCMGCQKTGDLVDFAGLLHPELSPAGLTRLIHEKLGIPTHELTTVEANALMDMEFEPAGYRIEKLLGKGVYLLAGASKIGKSWLVLYLADCVSKGVPLWGLRTNPCAVLYVSLEDTRQRIQQRLNDVTGGEAGPIHIATEAELLGEGFEDQLCEFLEAHPDVGLVIIDTLQRIRQIKSEKYSYAGDYEVMRQLKSIADKHNITLLLVHHTRKQEAADAFNMISGTTGLLGCADGALVLRKASRLTPDATLDVTGRELADLRLLLRFNDQTMHWDFVAFAGNSAGRSDPLLEAVRSFLIGRWEWQGTAAELLTQIEGSLPPETRPNILARRLNASATRLEADYGVEYRTSRSHKEKLIHLRMEKPPCVDASDCVDSTAQEPEPKNIDATDAIDAATETDAEHHPP